MNALKLILISSLLSTLQARVLKENFHEKIDNLTSKIRFNWLIQLGNDNAADCEILDKWCN